MLTGALVTCAPTQDPNSSLLRALIVSLLTSFSSDEAITSDARNVHSKCFLDIAGLASTGKIGDSEEAPQLLAQLVSAFTVLYNPKEKSKGETVYPVDTAVRNDH